NGFGKFRDQIILLENSPGANSLSVWFANISTGLNQQTQPLLAEIDLQGVDNPNKKKVIQYRIEVLENMVSFILMSVVELFNVAFGTVRFRSTVIKIKVGQNVDLKRVGKHW